MTGMATGMALSGKIVFTYSIANFPTMRCLEQIRNDVCYHQANVKIVAVGGGFAYGAMGFTHHATEDLAIMRMLPGITVMAALYRSAIRVADDWFPTLCNAKAPALILWGERDPYAQTEFGERLARNVSGRFEIIPGAGHWYQVEQPALVAQRLELFWSALASEEIPENRP